MMKIHHFFMGWMIFGFLLSQGAMAQRVVINPTQEGGFELPGGFVGNGWTVSNGTAVNQWHTGNLGVAGFNNNVAYISNDGGVTNAFTNTSASVVHFYRDVTFNPGENIATISFDWLGLGEVGFFDALIVSVAPTTYTPTASTISLGTSGLPAPTIEIARLWNTSVAGSFTANIPSSALGSCSAPSTIRLIFTWKNDGSGGNNPPTMIDNISLTASSTTPVGSGIFTINNTLPTGGTNFNSFTDAITWLNATDACGGITVPVVFQVSAGQTFNEFPPIITATGTAANTITFVKNGTGANPVVVGTNGIGATDGVLVIAGGDYFTFNGIDVADNANNLTANTQMEYGFLIRNASATNGAQNNTIQNCRITLNNTATGNRAILQSATTTGGGFTPTSAAGSNSNNRYQNITIESVYAGIYLFSNATFPDDACQILNCTIGGTTANSIGGTVSATQNWGIRVDNTNNVVIRGNTIRNVTTLTTTDGILATTVQGTTEISGNNIQNIRNASTTSTASATGIRISLAGTVAHSSRIFNNFVSEITSGFTGTATATRIIRGIFVMTGGTATAVHNVHFNSVRIDGSGSPNASSTAFEIGTASGPIMNIRNNIFANFTGAQTGTARHSAWFSTSATATGNTGSVSNYNDLFIANATNGFVGIGNTTTYATLANWQAATTQDANSIAVDPGFFSPTDLHVNTGALNGAADMTGITWVLTDIDGQTRVAPHDIGADDFSPVTLDLSVGTITNPSASVCYNASQAVELTISNTGVAAFDFAANNATLTVNVTGAITQTLTVTLNSNALNGGAPLAPGATLTVPMGNINMSAPGTYNFLGSLTSAADGIASNNTMAAPVVRTLATPLPLPYSENFNAGTMLPAGWSGTWSVVANAGVGPSNGLRVNMWSSTPNPIATMPTIGPIVAGANLSYDYRFVDFSGFANPGGTGTTFGPGDSVLVQISTDCGTTFTTVQAYHAGNHTPSNLFQTGTISLNSYVGQSIIVRFVGRWGAGGSTDTYLTVDNINIQVPPADDAGVSALVSPAAVGCYSATQAVTVTIRNYGTAALSNIPVTVNVTGAITQTLNGTFAGPLAGGATANFTLPGTIDMSAAGNYRFQAGTNLATDGNSANDTMSAAVTRTVNPVIALPYSEDFNAGTVLPTGWLTNGTFTINGTAGNGPSNGLLANLWSANPVVVAQMPTLGPITAGLNFTFDYRFTNYAFPVPNPGGTGTTFGVGDTVFVLISTDCGATFSVLRSFHAGNHTATNLYQTANISLAPFVGQNILIRFAGVWGTGGSTDMHVAFDNINICSTPADPTGTGAAICNGQTATVTASGTASSYTWFDAPSGGVQLGTGTNLTVTPTTNTTYFVQANNGSCASNNRAAVVVTVNAIPSAPASGGNASVCFNQSATISVSVPGGVTVNWYATSNGGTALASGNTYTTPNLVSNAFYFAEAVGTGGCISATRTQINVTINTPAAPTNVSSTPACAGQAATATATGGAGNYVWFDAATGGNQLATGASYSSTVSGVAFVEATSGGCSSTRVSVTLSIIPAPAQAFVNGTPSACEGSSTTVTLGNSGSNTYNWYDAPTGGTLLATGFSFNTPALNANTTYYVETDSLGCLSSGRTAITVNVTPLPGAPILIASPSSSICAGQTTTLGVSGGGSANWYDAQTGGNLLSSNSAIFNTPALNSTTTYYAQSVVNGCASVNRSSITITVSSPALPTNPQTDTICDGQSATISAQGQGTLSWYSTATGGTALGTGNSFNTGNLFAGTVTFFVEDNVNGCVSSRLPVVVLVNTADNASFSYDSTSYCIGASANPVPTITGLTGGSFSANNGLSVNALTGEVNLAGASAGNYTISYTTNGNCPSTSTFNISLSVCTGLDQLAAAANYSLFPNPNQGNFYLNYSGEQKQVDLRIVDVLGRMVYSQNAVVLNGQAALNIETQGLIPGSYFVQVIEGQAISTLRMVVK